MAVVCKKLNRRKTGLGWLVARKWPRDSFRANLLVACLVILFVGVGCECPARKKDPPAGEVKGSEAKPTGHVFVYKGDQSQQCGMQKGVTAEEMQRELSGITLYSMKKGHDQLMRTAVCGAPTGQINIYEIDAKDLQAAEQRGFTRLKTDERK